MRKAIYWFEGINAVLGIIVSLSYLGDKQSAGFLGIAYGYWVILVYCIFAIGCFVLFWNDKSLEKLIYDKVMTNLGNETKEGKIGLTPQEASFLLMILNQMDTQHGHGDRVGLVADISEKVPLNELLNKPCSICLEPRNIKSTKK